MSRLFFVLRYSVRSIYRRARKCQMLGNRTTARLCACRCTVDDADGALLFACYSFNRLEARSLCKLHVMRERAYKIGRVYPVKVYVKEAVAVEHD